MWCSNLSYFVGQVVPIAKSNVQTQVASLIPHPPLKRKAVADPNALLGQRRKIVPPPVTSDSTPQQKLSIPTIPAPIPAAVHIPPEPLHVKWKGRILFVNLDKLIAYLNKITKFL